MEGDRYLHYRVVAEVGRGAMGVVLEAEDEHLGRRVALKLLPDEIASQPAARRRLEQEARTLAALSHPGIAQVHGFEEDNGAAFLVLEFVPGDTLEEILRHRKLDTDEALKMALRIAAALEAAHARGVIHRDLKPANVKVTPDGEVKILDFGLGKCLGLQPEEASPGAPQPPLTLEGVVVGTVPYMSPEQALGDRTDERADVWAFGCLLYELLTGERAFPGDTHWETLFHVQYRDPDWTALPPGVPPGVRALLAACLAKDERQRLRSMADACVLLRQARRGPPVAEHDKRSRVLPWAAAGVLLGAVLARALWPGAPTAASGESVAVAGLVVHPAELRAQLFQGECVVAVSPDGNGVLYRGPAGDLFLRELNGDIQPKRFAAAGAYGWDVCFSPDGDSIAVLGRPALRTYPLAGGPPVDVVPDITWHTKGVCWMGDFLYYCPSPSDGVWKVRASGGESALVCEPDREAGELSLRWPAPLPDGRHLLVTLKDQSMESFSQARVQLLDTSTGERRDLVQGTFGRYSPSGHVLFVRQERFSALPFDARMLEVTGAPFFLKEQARVEVDSGAAQFAVSESGTLVTIAGPSRNLFNRELAWLSPSGALEPVRLDAKPYAMARISPDGSHCALAVHGLIDAIWVCDFDHEDIQPLTLPAEGNCDGPEWTSDGAQVSYASDGAGKRRLIVRKADGSGSSEPLPGGEMVAGHAWMPDGRGIILSRALGGSKQELWIQTQREELSLERLPTDLSGREDEPRQSPDGTHLAYTCSSGGTTQVFVQSLEDLGRRVQVSSAGRSGAEAATAPRWSPDGCTLYFLKNDRIWSAPITFVPELAAGSPQPLLDLGEMRWLDVHPADGRFLVSVPVEELPARGDVVAVPRWSQRLPAEHP